MKMTVKKMKATDWEKIITEHIPINELLYRIYKELLQLNNNMIRNLSIGKRFQQMVQQKSYVDG